MPRPHEANLHPKRPRRNEAPPRPLLCPLIRKAQELGIAYTTFRDRARQGEFTVFKIGSQDYVENVEIARWLESKKEQGAR